MSETPWTKGGWSVAERNTYYGVYTTDRYVSSRLVAACAKPHPDASANARLCAAAPELFDALDAMVRAYFDYHDALHLTEPVTGRAANAYALAAAALARARGDSA